MTQKSIFHAPKVLRKTESLCPHCLERIPAWYEEREDEVVYLCKECEIHGLFCTRFWEGSPAFSSWVRPKKPSHPRESPFPVHYGCPFDCGLCPRHSQHTCTALLEVTMRCSLRCPVCYADAGRADIPPDPPLEELANCLDAIIRQSGKCNLQISGGEPTERVDLPEIIALAKCRGFPFIQLNSNGLRFAEAPGYARTLAEKGLDSVYLQFDGLTPETYTAIRGRPLLDEKLKAIKACSKAGLGVVLVATVVPGVNHKELGELLRFAVGYGPGIRGLHLQPVASFGRFSWKTPENHPRLSLPELMLLLSSQSALISLEDFHPPGCEHALCSFSALYRRLPDSRLERIGSSCCSPDSPPPTAAEGAQKSKDFTSLHWKLPSSPAVKTGEDADAFTRFIAASGIEQRFTLSAMAFQDCMTLDLERIQGCCIHIATPSGRLVPFCAYNITGLDGTALHRGREKSKS